MITEAPEGVPATVLGALHSTDLATVTCAPPSDITTNHAMAYQLLQALGKKGDVTGRSRHTSEETGLVPIWLTAHRTEVLILTACQRLKPEMLIAVADMCAATPTALMLAVDHGYGQDVATSLRGLAPVVVPWPGPDLPPEQDQQDRSDDGEVAEDNAVRNATDADDSKTLVLPDIEYWLFLATCRRQLTASSYQRVESLYIDTHQRVATWLAERCGHGIDLTAEAAKDCLVALIEEQTTFEHVQIVSRAAQAAFHINGWFLDIDERELRSGLIRFPPIRPTTAIYRRLRAYREPARAGTIALYLSGATIAAIRATTVSELAEWRNDLTKPVAGVHPPEAAAPFLRAVLLARAVDGHGPSEPAFPGDERRAANDIRQGNRDLHLNLGEAPLSEKSTPAERRLTGRSVRIERLTP